MTSLQELRHSTAHVLGAAVSRLYPEALLDIGPPTDSGFYYDFGSAHRFSVDDFAHIEAEMARIVTEDQAFVRREVSRDEAQAFFAARGQTFKLSRLNDIPVGEAISLYTNGEFTDLCAGTHLASTGKIGAFKLLSLAGAYHRGDEKQAQLQRIYGTAFPSAAELEAHLAALAEAARRDHRKLGAQLMLFRVDAAIGSGLPLLVPRGAVIRAELEKLITAKLEDYGYERLYSPHIGSIDLYKTSGHYPYYAESMYEPIRIEDREFLLKPMNCPMHLMAYTAEPRSYRDLPQRYAEFGTVYRQEQSGELNGLVRVRGFTQDDGHILCTPAQLQDEFKACLRLVQEVMAIFGLKTRCRVSLRDPHNTQKYAEIPHGHRAALDVPAGASAPPRRGPGVGAVGGFVGFPQHKVSGLFARGVFVGGLAGDRAWAQLAPIKARKPSVSGERCHVEIHAAVFGAVGVAALQQAVDEKYLFRDVRHRAGFVMRRQEVERGAITVKTLGPVRAERGQRRVLRLRLADGFVVHIGEVAHVAGRQSVRLRHAAKHVLHREGAKVADVRGAIDGRAAAVKTERAAIGGEDRFFRAAEGVV